MQLYLMQADDAHDANNLDWFVVAPDVDEAKRQWRQGVRTSRGTPGRKAEMVRLRVILPDVSGTPFDGPARHVPWDELKTAWSHDPKEPVTA